MPTETKDEQTNLMITNKLYDSITLLTGNTKITTSNIVFITTNLMQIIEQYSKLTGPTKKDIIIGVVKLYVLEHLNGDEEKGLLMFIDAFLPSVIDIIISVDKKEMVIKIHKGLKSCFSCC